MDFSISRARLAFLDRTTEAGFQASYFDRNLQLGRICHLVGIFFYCVIGITDILFFNEHGVSLWLWMAMFVGVVMSLGFTASYVVKDLYARYWQPLFAFYILIGGAGYALCAMTTSDGEPSYLFVGIIFCLFFCYAFIRLTFVWAVAAGNGIIAAYTVAAVISPAGSSESLQSELFYMFAFNLLGMVVCYFMELMSRRDYILNQLLQKAESDTREMNARLENMVAVRTRKLNQANAELTTALEREKTLSARLARDERALQRSLDSLEQAESIAGLGYFKRECGSGKVYWSKGALRLLSNAGLSGEPSWEAFLATVHPEDQGEIRDEFAESFDKTPAGTVRIDMEFRLVKPDEEIIQLHCVAGEHEGGKSGTVGGVFQDITNRRLAEERFKKLEEQLIHAQKLESVGRLAGGVAHDYNNISGIIIGHAELAMAELAEDHALYESLKDIRNAALRASAITRQLLAFARKQTIDPRVIDLNDTVTNMLTILKRLIGEEIEMAWMPGQGIWPLEIDPSQVDQILANLCVNARDAIDGVGKVSIETGNITLDEAYCSFHAGAVPGDYLMLTVHDDGRGIPPAHMDKIFEPFFTTKHAGKGTGLGLATVYGIVKQNNGYINAYSEAHIGTTFKVYLPRYTGPLVTAPAETPAEMIPGRGETVLVVEDDEANLAVAKKILDSLSYDVLTAATPIEALNLAKENSRRISLLLTDVILPEMNGRKLADLITTICPDIKVLFMSGYTANVIAHRGVLEQGINFIPKPFSTRNLAAKIRQVIDGESMN
ncbi:MAG: ATP-binding protein [Desulfobacterales bacterium]|nr:ATP-binding protein [Desulfobacterales bacterium]